MRERRIYLLDPRRYRPEVIAVAFAKTSRSPEPFDVIAEGLSDETASQFHEKWVIGYGHASVAEHAVLHIAFENISRLAAEAIEGVRLASFTEKSTRFQIFNRESFYVPPEIAASSFRDAYLTTVERLFETYHAALEPVGRVVEAWFPRHPGEGEKAYRTRLRIRAMDVCRYLLPTATLTNIGMTVNARALEHGLRKWLSHPLAEVREIAQTVKAVALREVPTLLKYAEPNAYLQNSAARLREWAGAFPEDPHPLDGVRLVFWDPDAEVRFIAACLYRFQAISFEAALARARALKPEERRRVLDDALGGRSPFDVPIRELEHIVYTFDCLMDEGAYYDLKRHRMMTQTPQMLTAAYGYAVPRAIEEAGMGARYRAAVEGALALWEAMRPTLGEAAAYVLPNAVYRRVLMTMNLREAYHLCRLRGGPNGHFAYRYIAMRIYEAIRAVHPTLAAYMGCEGYPSSEEIAAQFGGVAHSRAAFPIPGDGSAV
ncbi:MAG TPA: FAD-dependent thymidylate synthase [Thermoflexus sp.]|nr:FAD-dependent thymidylate synthase [Thermoflexus sp.]